MAKKSKAKATPKGKRIDNGDTTATWQQPKAIVHTFNRIVPFNDIPKLVGDQGFGISFRLSDLLDSTEFTNLFDQYRINYVDYTFILKQSGASPAYPIIFWAEDHDDDAVPVVNEVLAKENCRILQFGATRTMIQLRVRPNITRNVYNGVTNGYERAPPGAWVDSAVATVPHYGVKYYIQNYNTTTNPNTTLSVMTRYNLSFKESR